MREKEGHKQMERIKVRSEKESGTKTDVYLKNEIYRIFPTPIYLQDLSADIQSFRKSLDPIITAHA